MDAIDVVIGACIVAAAVTIGWGCYDGVQTNILRKKASDALEAALDTYRTSQSDLAGRRSEGLGNVEQQAALSAGSNAAAFVNALGNLAKGMAGLSRSIQAFLISALFVFLATFLAALDAVRSW